MPPKHYPSSKLLKVRHKVIRDQKRAVETSLSSSQYKSGLLRMNKAYYNHTLAEASEGCQIIGFDWQYIYINSVAAHYERITVDEILGKTLIEQHPGLEETFLFSVLKRCMVERRIERIENQKIYPDGSSAWFELLIQPVPEGIFIQSLDITERKSKERQLRYHAALQENVSDAVIVTDMNLRIQSWNQAATRIYGWTLQEAIGKVAPDFLQIRFPAAQSLELADLQSNENKFLQQETIQRRKDGTDIFVLGAVTQLEDENGAAIGIIAINRDITKRKAQEQQLRYNASIQESMSDAVIATDMEFRIRSWNRAAEMIYGWSATEVIGKFVNDILQTKYETVMDRTNILKNFLEDGVWQGEVVQYHRNGNPINILGSANLFKDDWGKAVGIVSVNRDITERKLAAEALNKSMAEIQDLYNKAPCGYHSIDKNAKIIQINETELNWLGYTYDEVINKLKITDILTPDSLSVFRERFPVFMEKGQAHDIELEMVRKNGSTLHVLLNSTAIYDEHGQYLRSRSTLFDITELRQTQQAINESEIRYRLLAENINDVIAKTNPEGIRTFITPSCFSLVGYTPDELQGQPSIEIVHPDEQADTLATVMEAISSKKTSFSFTRRFCHKLGHYVWAEVNNNLIYDANGNPLEIIAVIRDITERKLAEDELHKVEHRYYSLFEQSHDAVFLLDMQGNHIDVNHRAAEMFGYDIEELRRLSFREISAEVAKSENVFKRLAQGDSIPMYERVLRKKDGTHILGEINIEVVRNRDGNPLHIQTVMRDITERKRTEEALKESEEQYRSLVETMHGGLAVFDTDFKLIYINDRFCDLLGYSRGEIIGKKPIDFVDEASIPLVQSHLERRQNAESSSYEAIMRHKDGHMVNMLLSGSPLLDKQGKYNGSIAVATDISIQKLAETSLRQALAKEKELNDLKTRFVSMASHEFRTPLASILALVETLSAYRHKLSDEQIDTRFDKIKGQINHLKDIMEDVLMLARMQARRVEFNPVWLDLDSLLRNVIDEFENRPDINQRIEYKVSEGKRDVMLDPKLMRQIISNLMSNAIKYSGRGEVISLSLEYTNTEVILSVNDEGIGIPEDDLPYLFEPFHRAKNVGMISGTGLGLVIARESVELHSGSIQVQSQVGVGTTFFIHIPTGIN